MKGACLDYISRINVMWCMKLRKSNSGPSGPEPKSWHERFMLTNFPKLYRVARGDFCSYRNRIQYLRIEHTSNYTGRHQEKKKRLLLTVHFFSTFQRGASTRDMHYDQKCTSMV